MAASQTVTVEYSGNLAIVTLDNQEKLNALSQEDYYKLASTLREIAQHDEVLVTLLIGKGRFFSAYVHNKPTNYPREPPHHL